MDKLQFNRIPFSEGANKIGPKNASVQYFSGDENEKIDSLIRETIQNPLDHIKDKSKPLRMEFEELLIQVDEIPFEKEIKKTIDALIKELEKYNSGGKGQVSKYLKYYREAKTRLSNKHILCVRISDFNTVGLKGSREEQKSTAGRLLGGTGFFDDASTGGGSGGLGKFAPFRFSAVNFCFYSSLNDDDEYVYYGWGNNFYHEINGKKFMGETNIGTKTDVYKRQEPYQSGFLSNRKEYGTDVFIIGQPVRFMNEWIDTMTLSVIRNFFGAIKDEKLEVTIKNIGGKVNKIDSKSINNYLDLFDSNQRRRVSKGIPEDNTILECIDAYENGTVFNSLKTEVKTPILGECEVRILQNDDFSKQFLFMRGPRMLIYTEKKHLGDLPYSGVFCCKSEKGNGKLRNIEDSHHKAWPFEKKGEERKIKKEIDEFIKYCVNEVAAHESEDNFGLSGTAFFSLGSNSKKKKKGTKTDDTTEEETSIIYPKETFKNKLPTNFKYGGVVIVDKKGKRKKKEPKKPPYVKREEQKPSSTPGSKEREYRISEFKAQIFKNDSSNNEYHLFVESDRNITIRNIFFSIPGADGISFIDSIKDQSGNTIMRDKRYKDADNAFENMELHEGSNKFKVMTKFNNKVEILIK